MMGFEDFATAAKFRDLVTKIAEDVVERTRPRYRYATVMTIDRVTRTATVQFPGETSTVKVGMGAIQPSATGQRVRIHGVQGERYIADVIGDDFGTAPYTKPVSATTDPGNATRGITLYSNQSLNKWMSTGFYNGDNMTGAPSTAWWYIHNMTHTNGTDSNGGWHRQVAYGMTGDKNIYTRRCDGQNPTVAGNWSVWSLISSEDTSWQEVTSFGSGWSAYATGVNNHWTPRYRRRNGVVFLEGLVSGGPTGSAFTLPVGYRPATVLMRGVVISGGTLQRLDINPNGDVYFGEGTQTTGWHSINASFNADN